MHFKVCQPGEIENQIKYGFIKVVKFYNSFKKCLKDNDIEMYSTYNEGESVVAERFMKTLKNKIDKHMTAV